MRRLACAYEAACRHDAQQPPNPSTPLVSSALRECRVVINDLQDERDRYADAEERRYSHSLRVANTLIGQLITDRDYQRSRAENAENELKGSEYRLARVVTLLVEIGHKRAAIEAWLDGGDRGG